MSFEEAIGKGEGARVNAIKKIIADKKFELQPLADDLTDAYQASIISEASEHFDAEHDKKIPEYIMIVAYLPSDKSYSIKVAHEHEGLVHDFNLKDKKSLDDWGYSLSDAALAHASFKLSGAGKQHGLDSADPRGTEIKSGIWHQSDESAEIIPDKNQHSYEEYRSNSLHGLLTFVNKEILGVDHQIDISKYANPAVSHGIPG